MIIKRHHPWDLDCSEAIKLQGRLASKMVKDDAIGTVDRIAGVDAGYRKNSRKVTGAVLVFSYPGLDLLEASFSEQLVDFPYIPGLLAFREGPVILKCFEKIKNMPDLILFDGNGFMHPRRMGIATHIGILLDTASIGCAKSRLCGEYRGGQKKRGEYELIKDRGDIIGAAVVTRDDVRPVFVSQGHKISLESAIRYTLSVSRFRIPEPIRWAHNYLKQGFT